MPEIISIPTYTDSRGSLSVIEKFIPFDIKRIYYIYNVDESERGRHAHKETVQFLISVSGSCEVFVKNKQNIDSYILDDPTKGLILFPEDFHWMDNFTSDCVLFVLASKEFDKSDYIYEN